jgi:hypothetical protein
MQQFVPIVLVLWAGAILGVSFIATLSKFLAPHLTMSVALEVGKATFHVFNKIEWGIGILAVLCTVYTSEDFLKWVLSSSLLLLLLLETFWLMPYLDIRTDQVIAGGHAKPGIHHKLYIIIEVLKVIGALGGGWWLAYRE